MVSDWAACIQHHNALQGAIAQQSCEQSWKQSLCYDDPGNWIMLAGLWKRLWPSTGGMLIMRLARVVHALTNVSKQDVQLHAPDLPPQRGHGSLLALPWRI